MIPIASHCLLNIRTVSKASCVAFKAGMFWPHGFQVQNTHYKMAVMKRWSAAIDVFDSNIYELSVTHELYNHPKIVFTLKFPLEG